MKRLVKTAAVMGVATFAGMVTGVLRAKFTAVFLGSAGVGIFAQAMTFFQTAETVCGLGITLGITKYVSEAWSRGDLTGVRRIIFSSLAMQCVSFAVCLAAAAVFSGKISELIFSTDRYAGVILMVLAAALFSSFAGVMESTLLGMRKADLFSRGRVIYLSAGLAAIVLLVLAMGLTGSFVYILLSAAVAFLVTSYFVRKNFKSKNKSPVIPVPEMSGGLFRSVSGRILSYGGISLANLAASWITILYIRSTLIRYAGPSANGLYQVIFAMSNYYTPFFTNAFWGHVFPKISALKDAKAVNLELNTALRFILLFLTPILGAIALFKKELILLIFSGEFLPGMELFPMYLLGSMFYMLIYLLGTNMLASKRLKPFLLMNVGQNLFYAALFTVFIKKMGILGISAAYLITNAVWFAVIFVYQLGTMELKIYAGNVRIFALGMVLMAVVFFAPSGYAALFVVKCAMLAAWLVFVMGKREKALFRSFITR